MKKKIFTLVFAGFFLITINLVGQNKDYPTKKINAIEYYIYTVQPSEGLYAIGRKFEISPAELSKANPDTEKGLKPGQQILIPVQNPTLQKVIEKKNNKKPEQEFIQYKVKKKQTLFAISNKFNVSQEDIIKYNPDIKDGLREGVVLHIPKEIKISKKKAKENEQLAQLANQNSDIEKNKQNGIHQVQPQETLYSIARLYNVKVIDIIRLNPGSSTKLAVGSELKIPKSETNTNDLDNKNANYESSNSNEKKTIKIAFLLPFMLDQDKSDPSVERFVEFYAGALIAIEDAKKKGISLEIYTFDTEKSEEKMNQVLGNPELKSVDLIIGPAFSNQVSSVAEFAKENKINTLIPFTSKVPEIENNSYLFQFNPGADAEMKFTKDLLKDNYKKANIVFAEVPGISSSDEGRIKFETLQKEFIKERKQFSTIKLTTSDQANFDTVLNKKEKNIIIFNTDKYAYISPYITPIRSDLNDYEIVLFEQYNWKNQKEKLQQNIYISPFKSNIDSTKIDSFDEQFTQLFYDNSGADSPRFDLLGYDLSSYFISLLNRYSDKFYTKIGSFTDTNDIQSLPHFERSTNGSGFINQQLYLGEDNAE